MIHTHSQSLDDYNRVQLKGDPDVEGSDYINASFIDVSIVFKMLANSSKCSDNHVTYTGLSQQEEKLHSSQGDLKMHLDCVSHFVCR